MASRSATAAGSVDLEIYRNIPLAKFNAILVDQFHAIACVRGMTDAAGAAFALVGYMHIVEVPAAVTEGSINGGLSKGEEILVMTSQACTVKPFFVGCVQVGRITPPEHTEVVGTMGVVTALAFTLINRSVQIFFPGKISFDISQSRSTHVILIVAAKTDSFFVSRQKPFALRIVSRVTINAPPFLLQRFMRNFYSGYLFTDISMTVNTQIRHFFLNNCLIW